MFVIPTPLSSLLHFRYEVIFMKEVLYIHSAAEVKVQFVAYVLWYQLTRSAGGDGQWSIRWSCSACP